MQEELQEICVEVEEVCLDLARHKCTLTPSMASTSSSNVHRIDVPKPNPYNDARNAIVIDNFIFGLEQHFHAISVRDEALKVGTIPKFL